MSADAAPSGTSSAAGVTPPIRCTRLGGPCISALTCSLTSRRPAWQTSIAYERHVAVEVTCSIYQRAIAADRYPHRAAGKVTMTSLITSIAKGVPTGRAEATRLGRTPAQAGDDVFAYFDRPGTSNGPAETINGRLKHLRDIALDFRNLTHYIARSLLEASGFKRQLHR